MNITVKNKFPNVSKVRNAITEYQQKEPMPTFTGLLNHLGITWTFYNKARNQAPSNPVILLMEQYRQHLEEQFEKQLIYQYQKGYNYQALQFVMKKLNQERYGDKTMEVKRVEVKPTTSSVYDNIDNESGICLAQSIKS